MAKDPFYYKLDEEFRGTRVRVQTSGHTYEGWVRMWHYSQHAILLYDVTRDDGEQLGPVAIDKPETVERLASPGSNGSIQEIAVDAIRPSPYSVRDHDDPDHQQFVRQTRERGHLLTFPTVRPLAEEDGHGKENEYETIGGHRRMEAARRADLQAVPVRVIDCNEWEAACRFIDEHIPIRGADGQGHGNGLYAAEEIEQALTELVKILGTSLVGNIVQCPGRDRVGLGDRSRPHLVGVGVFVPERRMASLPANRDEPVFRERLDDFAGGKRRSNHALLEPRRGAVLPDFDVDPELLKVRLGVVDRLAVSTVTIQRVGELSECLCLGVAERRYSRLNMPSRHAAVILTNELDTRWRLGNRCHTHRYVARRL
jgi:hypothetical protein